MLASHLGLRWLRRRRAAWLALAAVALTVAVPIFVIDLFQGWYRLVAVNARANEADVVLRAPEGALGLTDSPALRRRIGQVEGAAGIAPLVDSWAIMSRGRGESIRDNLPCQVEGIEWAADVGMGRLREPLLHPQPILELRAPALPPEERGSGFLTPAWRAHTALAGIEVAAALGGLPAALPPAPRPRPGIVCGRELMYQVAMRPGETVQLAIPNGTGGTIGKMNAEVSDTIGTGVLEADRYMVLAPLPQAQRLAGLHARAGRQAGVSGYRVNGAAGSEPRRLASALREATGLRAATWEQLRGNYVKSQEIQRNLAIVAMCAIQIITVFVVYAVFSTMVVELRHDIGVLRGLGARRRDLGGALLAAGLATCLVGGLVGWGLGWGALAALNPLSRTLGFSLFPEDVFYTPDAPTSFDWWIPPLFIGSMTAIGVLAVALPAWRATRVDPIRTLREGE